MRAKTLASSASVLVFRTNPEFITITPPGVAKALIGHCLLIKIYTLLGYYNQILKSVSQAFEHS